MTNAFSAAYDAALRALMADLIANPPRRYVLPEGLNPLDPQVDVEADMDTDGYDTSGYYAVITLRADGHIVATYLDLGELIRDLSANVAVGA